MISHIELWLIASITPTRIATAPVPSKVDAATRAKRRRLCRVPRKPLVIRRTGRYTNRRNAKVTTPTTTTIRPATSVEFIYPLVPTAGIVTVAQTKVLNRPSSGCPRDRPPRVKPHPVKPHPPAGVPKNQAIVPALLYPPSRQAGGVAAPGPRTRLEMRPLFQSGNPGPGRTTTSADAGTSPQVAQRSCVYIPPPQWACS